MDTSKKYIKMCKEAEEIQNYRDKSLLQDGDFIFLGHDITDEEGISVYSDEMKNWIAKIEVFFVWIPRQDQLQEMISFKPWNEDDNREPLHRLFFEFRKFVQWDDEDSWWSFKDDFTSFEQLWLAFVMREKYKKEWNMVSEKWEVVNE
jgi:hypothetical protein